VDIGGRGFGADGESIHGGGLRMPVMHLARAGEVNLDLLEIVRWNVREADQVVGDIYALAACNETGIARLRGMLDEFDLPDLAEVGAFVLENSRRATIEKIAALPKGRPRTP